MARIEHDAYYTDERLTLSLIERVRLFGTVFEPCAGHNDIARVIDGNAKDVAKVLTGDIRRIEEAKHDFPGFDATHSVAWALVQQSYDIDWVVTNPPYATAAEGPAGLVRIVDNAYTYSRRGFAVLVRLTFLEPTLRNGNRRALLHKIYQHGVTEIIYNPRPRFIKGSTGSDSATVMWLVCDKLAPKGIERIFHCDWDATVKTP